MLYAIAERILLVGGLSSSHHQNEFVNLENSLSGPCSNDSTTILNDAKLYTNVIGGISNDGKTIIACGDLTGKVECIAFTGNKTITHQPANIRSRAASVFLKSGLLYVTGGYYNPE